MSTVWLMAFQFMDTIYQVLAFPPAKQTSTDTFSFVNKEYHSLEFMFSDLFL